MKTFQHITVTLFIAMVGSAWAAGNHTGGHQSAVNIGKAGVASQVTRTIEVDMSDAMRFTPASIAVKQGETVRFVVKNSGKLSHEFVLGSEQELKEHYEVMKKNPGMEHADDNMITVAPGKTGEVVWQFTQAGKVAFACLHPGHYDAGMKGQVVVAKSGTPAVQVLPMVEAEVRKVDMDAKKITLKHGEIKNLGMPAMSMVFQVQNVAFLDKVKAGDKVKFAADKIKGVFTVVEIERTE